MAKIINFCEKNNANTISPIRETAQISDGTLRN